eukprot:11596079-Heterocapsa_arctica.AAC.1
MGLLDPSRLSARRGKPKQWERKLFGCRLIPVGSSRLLNCHGERHSTRVGCCAGRGGIQTHWSRSCSANVANCWGAVGYERLPMRV